MSTKKSNSNEEFESDIEGEFGCADCISHPSNTCRTCWRKFCDKHIKRHNCVGFAENISSIIFPIDHLQYDQYDLWRFKKRMQVSVLRPVPTNSRKPLMSLCNSGETTFVVGCKGGE